VEIYGARGPGRAELVVIETASQMVENCPAGLLSTKDALDDGNAYGSAALAATAGTILYAG
jgi:hypothetical protein